MRNWSYLCFLLLLLAACKPTPSNKPAALTPALPNPDSAAVAGTLHRFFTWYDSVSRTPNWKRGFTDTRGKYAKLDQAKLDRYFNSLRASGLLSAEYFSNEKKYLDQCAAIWKSHKEKDEMLSGLDHDRLICAQDWDLAFWASAPVRLLETDSNRVEATLYGTEGGTQVGSDQDDPLQTGATCIV